MTTRLQALQEMVHGQLQWRQVERSVGATARAGRLVFSGWAGSC